MEYKILERMFQDESPTSVFEMGTGAGGLLGDLKSKYPDLKVAGIDNHKGDHETVKKMFPDGEFIYQDAWNTPWNVPDKAYDIVFTVGFFTVVDRDPTPVLKEMLRIGKKIILAELTGDSKYTEEDKVRVGRDYLKYLENPIVINYSPEKTIYICE